MWQLRGVENRRSPLDSSSCRCGGLGLGFRTPSSPCESIWLNPLFLFFAAVPLSLYDRITLHSNFKSLLQRHRRCDALEWTKSPVRQNLRVGPRLEIILHAYLSNWAITKFRLLLKLYLSEFIRTSIFIAWKIFGSPAWLRFTLMLSDLHQKHSCYNILFSTHTRSL